MLTILLGQDGPLHCKQDVFAHNVSIVCAILDEAASGAMKRARPNLATTNFGGQEGGSRGGMKRWVPEESGPKGGRPKISRFAFFLPLPFSFFFFSLSLSLSPGIFSCLFFSLCNSFRGILCFGRSGPQMCLFSSSGCRVEAPDGLQPARRGGQSGGEGSPAGRAVAGPGG